MAGYLGASPVPQTIQKKQSFTATASQTTFTTTGYTDGQFINVYLNGVRLINGTDYTATNGSDIVLTSAASASDVLDFETFNEFTLVDQTLETPTFTDSATVTSTTTASLSVSGDTTATLSLKNNTHEDTDGGRESTLIFKGEQSGGEISTLAEIEASHDGTSDDQKGDLIFRTNDGSDGTSPTEAMRIDSSQHIVFGKTAADNTTAGTTIYNGLGMSSVRDASLVAIFNRLTDDGTIIDLRKDSSSTGKIGTIGGGMFIGDGDVGLEMDGANNAIYPINTTTLANTDNHTDLGDSDKRFKDIYIGGGAYIGGTTGSNYLEDYEEGTWTPTITGGSVTGTGTYSSQTGAYTKIGRMVHLTFDYGVTAHTGSGTYNITNFPFTVGGGTGVEYTGSVMVYNFDIVGSATAINLSLYTGNGSTTLRLYSSYDNTLWQANNLDTNHSVIGSITFYI